MLERNCPVFLKDENGNPIRVGWATLPNMAGDRSVIIDATGPGREAYNVASQGVAQGFTYGEPVNDKENY